MAAYFAIYEAFESSAVPVLLPPMSFGDVSWDQGYVELQGSLKDDAATSPGEELPLQTTYVVCVKSAMLCTVAMANVLDGYMGLDNSTYDIASWTNNQITFDNDLPICATQHFEINRSAKTFTMTGRKRAIIPDYALKSPLHPCAGRIDKTLTLTDGLQVYWHKEHAFEQRNSLYFHILLLVMNALYVFGLYRLWRWWRDRNVTQAPAL
jgi:hypothetical protein